MHGDGHGIRVTRRGRIVLAAIGALIVFFGAGPPDFAAGYLFTAWGSELDGGAHKLHLLMRGVGTVLTLVAGIALIVKPSWTFGAVQKFIATGLAFPLAGLTSLYFWPPVVVYPLMAIIVTVVMFIVFRGQQPLQALMPAYNSYSKPVLALAVLIGVPLFVWGLGQASLQRSSEFLHGDLGHWAGGMATALMIILLMLFAAMRSPGWRIPAWSAGFTLLMLGVASVYWPSQASSVGTTWGAIAIVAAVGFVGAAELEGRVFLRKSDAPATASTGD